MGLPRGRQILYHLSHQRRPGLTCRVSECGGKGTHRNMCVPVDESRWYIELVCFLKLFCIEAESSLYNPFGLILYKIGDLEVLLPFCGLPLHFLDDVLWCTETLILVESSLLSHSFVTYAFDAYPRNRCKVPCQEDLLPFPSQSFAALPHVVGSLARCDPAL